MLKDSPFLDDLAKMASAAAGSVMDMKREIETIVQSTIDSWMAKSQFVTRAEFEVVREMVQKARTENEALRAELEALKAAKSKKG